MAEFFEDSLFLDEEDELNGPSIEDETITFNDGMYTTKVVAPHYIPNGPKPLLSDLYDTRKYEQLVREINESNLSDDQKTFLKLAATRFIVFNFGRIANYYAYESKEMQEQMEKSALVIIDFGDAVKNGFVKLDQRIDQFVADQLAIREAEKNEQ